MGTGHFGVVLQRGVNVDGGGVVVVVGSEGAAQQRFSFLLLLCSHVPAQRNGSDIVEEWVGHCRGMGWSLWRNGL